MSKKRTVVVVGASGFIGSFICKVFGADGWRVVGIGSRPEHTGSGCEAFWQVRLPAAEIGEILAKEAPEAVVHCAGSASVADSLRRPSYDFHNNCVVTHGLLEALRLNSAASKFVFLSSAAVYGNPGRLPIKEQDAQRPISPYGFHKLQCELLCQEYFEVYGVQTACLRIFSAYGPGLKRQVLWDMCSKLRLEGRLCLEGTGLESRDFIHVQDVARAILITVERASFQAECYNLASGAETSIAELASLVCAGLFPSVSSFEFSGLTSKGVPSNWLADLAKMRALGFYPRISLPQGVGEYCKWFETIYHPLSL